jgi:hypothetical protein
VLLLLLAAVALPQTKVLLYTFEPRGVDQSLIRTTQQLLKDALNGTYRYVVVDPAPGTNCYGVIAAAESAKVYNAGRALIGNVMTIGGRQMLTYQLVEAATAAVVLQDRVDLPGMDELPTVAERIAQSVVALEPYNATAEPERMTSAEVEPRFKRPRKPYAGMFLSAGYQFLLTDRANKLPRDTTIALSKQLVNLNVAVSFETQNLLTMMQMGLLRGVHDESDVTFDLTANYIAGRGDFAPFFGGGIGITRYSWSGRGPSGGTETQHNDGMNLSAGMGVLGLRTYYFRLMLAAYGNYTFAANDWGRIPGVRVVFGVSTPTLGPDATVRTNPACVGAVIGGFFLTGLIIALVS